jgi:hypothetical protein
MLDELNAVFTILANGPPASLEQIEVCQNRFQDVPREYVELISEVTELEIQHQNGEYVRIWGPIGAVEMDIGYNICKRIPGAIPIGDDGGGHVFIYANGISGRGLYRVGFGDLDLDDAVWIAPTLAAMLIDGVGI